MKKFYANISTNDGTQERGKGGNEVSISLSAKAVAGTSEFAKLRMYESEGRVHVDLILDALQAREVFVITYQGQEIIDHRYITDRGVVL